MNPAFWWCVFPPFIHKALRQLRDRAVYPMSLWRFDRGAPHKTFIHHMYVVHVQKSSYQVLSIKISSQRVQSSVSSLAGVRWNRKIYIPEFSSPSQRPNHFYHPVFHGKVVPLTNQTKAIGDLSRIGRAGCSTRCPVRTTRRCPLSQTFQHATTIREFHVPL